MGMNAALCQIADALQMELKYRRIGKAANFAVEGQATGTYHVQDVQFTLPMNMRVVANFAEEALGVIVHVMGRLYIMAAHLERTGVTSVFIIDGGKLSYPPEKSVLPIMSLGTVVGLLKAGIVNQYIFRDQKWTAFTLPT